jgi:hypothetical protein
MRIWTVTAALMLTVLVVSGAQWSRAQLATNVPQQALRPTIRILELTPDERKDLVIARQNGVRQRVLSLISRLPKGQVDLDRVNSGKVPVMLLAQDIRDLRVFPNALHYTATGTQPGLQFELHGTRQTFTGPVTRLAPGRPRIVTPTINGFANLRTEKSEVGTEVSWSRYGAYYHLTISCDDPDHDPRCTPVGATAIAMASVYIGGGE